MIQARVTDAAKAAGVHAPALTLVRRIAFLPGERSALADELAAMDENGGDDALNRIAAGAPIPALPGTPAFHWLPGGGMVSERRDAGSATLAIDNLQDACLIAAAEAGLPLLLHEAAEILDDLVVDLGEDPYGQTAVSLTCGSRTLSTIGASGCAIDPDATLRPETTLLLLFAPGNERTDAASTRSVCIRAIRLMRRTCPQVYAQIVPFTGVRA